MVLSANVGTINEDREEYDDSDVETSELTYVMEREEALWNEEVIKGRI